MDEAQMAKLLGRPLTTREEENFDEYLDIAEEMLEDTLCYSPFATGDSSDEGETRYFNTRDGYSTVFTGAFTDVSSVVVDGEAVTTYKPFLWDTRNSDWYNSIIFDDKFTEDTEIEVTAAWGFENIPLDLQRLLSQYFALVSSGAKVVNSIQSKKVEDFSITYANADQPKVEAIANQYASTINKYSICNIGNVKHGKVCYAHGRFDCGYCI